MRHIIAYEGKDTVPGQFLEHNSIYWEEDKIPVMNNDNRQELLGVASDIRRENGELTAEIEWYNEQYKTLVESRDMAVTVYCSNVDDTRDEDGNRIVHKARLRALYPTMGVPWAKAGYGWPGIPKEIVD